MACMLLAETRIGPSGIHGLGLFAAAPIAAGAPFWRFEAGFDQSMPLEAWEGLPVCARQHARMYGFFRLSDRALVLSGDFSRFMNHSSNPNTGMPSGDPGAVATVALRDIAEGEELTCNYWAFDADAAWKLGWTPVESPVGSAQGLQGPTQGITPPRETA